MNLEKNKVKITTTKSVKKENRSILDFKTLLTTDKLDTLYFYISSNCNQINSKRQFD